MQSHHPLCSHHFCLPHCRLCCRFRLSLLLTQVLLVCSDAGVAAELSSACENALVPPRTHSALLAGAAGSTASAPAATRARPSPLDAEAHSQSLLSELGAVLELCSAVAEAVLPSRGSASSCARRQLGEYSWAELCSLRSAARRLAGAAVRAGCPRVASALLPVAGAGLDSPAALLDVLAGSAREGLTGVEWSTAGLLHIAVASQSTHMVWQHACPAHCCLCVLAACVRLAACLCGRDREEAPQGSLLPEGTRSRRQH
jgi:hypothetical protein